MSDFDKHWDTRIEANKRLFNEKPGIANFAYDEALLAYEYAQTGIEDLKNVIRTLIGCIEDMKNTLIYTMVS